jgi:hypothetical protein
MSEMRLEFIQHRDFTVAEATLNGRVRCIAMIDTELLQAGPELYKAWTDLVIAMLTRTVERGTGKPLTRINPPESN